MFSCYSLDDKLGLVKKSADVDISVNNSRFTVDILSLDGRLFQTINEPKIANTPLIK